MLFGVVAYVVVAPAAVNLALAVTADVVAPVSVVSVVVFCWRSANKL